MSYHESGSRDRNCVKNTIKQIIDAQREAAGGPSHDCDTSCERSIDDLLSPSRDRGPRRHTTIPFMLVCKDGCSTFFGSGFTGRGGHRHGHFHCVESPVFKVQGFVKGSHNCVRLELLTPIYHKHRPRGDGEEGHREPRAHHGDCGCGGGGVCGYFGHRPVENFRATGVCITVDLDCFCGISCLDPITPAK